MSRSEQYELQIHRDADGRIAEIDLAVTDLEGEERRVRVDGTRAAHVAAPLQEVLRSAGLKGRDWTSSKPLELKATLGAHAELMLRAVKPLRRIDRITDVADGIASMSREEASYWHAQTRRRHGLKALRILLDGGVVR